MVEDASLLMLGNLAIEKQLIVRDQLDAMLDEQKKSQIPLGEIFIKRKLVTRNQLKVLLDIHNLKVFYYDSIRFGFLAIVNSFATEEDIRKALELQKLTSPRQYIGDILIQQGVLKPDQRDGLLKTQKRLTRKQEDQEQTFVKCPFCDQSYSIVDPDRYRKVRCRNCNMVFEVGISKQEIRDTALEFSNKTPEPEKPLVSFEKTTPNIEKVNFGLEKPPLRKTESNDLQRLSSFLQYHKIDSGITLENRPEGGIQSNNRKYIFGNELARGGMGAIVETIDTDIKRQVVTKILLRNDSREAIVKFIEEAQITGQLEHPNIVPVYDLGVNDEGLVYFTMKRVRGETLLRIIEKLRKKDPAYIAKYPLDTMVEILLKVCDGVAFAHQKGVIHRDLKPENIMVGEFGEVLTMDWGLAKVLGKTQATEKIESLDDAALKTIRNDKGKAKTLQGTIAGTPEYMSPEQAKGNIDKLTVCSDVYSLGGVLYTILEHRLPAEGKNHHETLSRVIKGELNDFHDETSPELASIVYKAMAYEQEDRYQSVNEFKDDLLNYLRGYSVSAKEDTFLESSVKLIRRNRFLSLSLAMIFLIVSVSFVIVLIMANRNANNRLEALEKAKALDEQAKANALDRKISAPSLLDAAKNFVNSKNYNEAKDKINLAIEFDPDLPDSYYYKGLLDYYAEDYTHAIQSFKTYEDKILYQNKPQYPFISVNGLMKNLYRLQDVGMNTVDLFEVRSFFEINKLPGFVEITEAKMAKILVRYENIAYAIDPKLEVKLKNGGVTLVMDKIRAKPAALNELLSVPVTEINLETSGLHDVSFLNKTFLKRLILNGCELDSPNQIASFSNLEWLEISDTKISDIRFLNGLKLRGLYLANCEVADLSITENMPLTHLDVTGLPIRDIEFMRKMPLVLLRMGNTKVYSLEPLKNKKLEWLSIWQTGIKSLKDIKGQPITHLDIEHTLIDDLSDLLGSKVERLYLDGENLDERTVGIINQLHLKFLSIRSFKEQNLKGTIEIVPVVRLTSGVLSEINKLNLKNVIELDLGQCPELKSLKGIASINTLEKITLPTGFKNIAPLTSLPKLKYVVTPEYGQQAASTFFQMQKAP